MRRDEGLAAQTTVPGARAGAELTIEGSTFAVCTGCVGEGLTGSVLLALGESGTGPPLEALVACVVDDVDAGLRSMMREAGVGSRSACWRARSRSRSRSR